VPQSEVSQSRLAEPRGDTAAELSAITLEFPGWRPWVSDGGRWWAMTVDADDADKLRKAIAEQGRLESTVGAT
jgi:hypothetical protein